MRRLRPWFAATDSGGRGSSSGPTTGLCRLTAGRVREKAGESPLDIFPVPGSAVPRTEKPPVAVADCVNLSAGTRRKATRGGSRRSHGAGPRDNDGRCAFRRVVPLAGRGVCRVGRFAPWRDTDGAWAGFGFMGGTRDASRVVFRTRCSVLHAAAQSRDPGVFIAITGAPDLRSNTSRCVASGEQDATSTQPLRSR